MAAEDGLVHVAGCREVHDDVPAKLLGEHLKGVGHIRFLCQHCGIELVGHSEQQPLAVAFQPPHLQVACRRHQRTIVIVHRVAQSVVVAVELSARFEQLHLVGEAPFGEHADGFLRGRLGAAEGHIEVYNLLHTAADAAHIVVGKLAGCLSAGCGACGLLEVAVESAREGVLDEQLALWKHVVGSLVEHEAERAHVDPMARTGAPVEELHVAVLVQTELQSLRCVVHPCRYHGVGQGYLRLETLVDINQ